MTLTRQERALLVKLFYQNGDFATETLRKFRSLKWLRNGPLTSQDWLLVFKTDCLIRDLGL